jgi:hypothetical protein
MTIKSAALLALVGVCLLTLVLLAGLARDAWAVLNGVIPAVTFLASVIYALAAMSVAVFFFVFHRAQG